MNSDEETQCNIEYELYKKYQTIIHNDPPEKCSKSAFIRFLVNSPLKVALYVYITWIYFSYKN